LSTAAREEMQRARTALSLLPSGLQRDPTVLPTLQVIQSALPPQLEAIATLAASGDWRAVQLRLSNQVRPLETLTSALVEKVDREAAEQRVETVLNVRRVQRLVFLVVPVTAAAALLIAAALGLAITRSITGPLARLVEGSKALARGEFQHQVTIEGDDELAHLGQVFNDTARRLRDLYAVLQSSEDRLRLVIDTIPATCLERRARRLRRFHQSTLAGIYGFIRAECVGLELGLRSSFRRPAAVRRADGSEPSRLGNRWKVKHGCGRPMGSIDGF
jgi:HAMP domain-containing protein